MLQPTSAASVATGAAPPDRANSRQARTTSGAGPGPEPPASGDSRPSRYASQQREPLRPAAGRPQPLTHLHALPSEDRFRGKVDVRQLAGRQSQQGAGAQRVQAELDAGLTALVGDQRRAGVQTAQEGAVGARCLRRIGVAGQRERLIEGEDQGEPGRGEPTVPGRRQSGLPVAGVPADVRPEWGRGDRERTFVHGAGAGAGRRFT
nr:hypothetical protein [Streptomyces sp. ISID311]